MFEKSSVRSYSPWPPSCRDLAESMGTSMEGRDETRTLISLEFMEPRTAPHSTWFHVEWNSLQGAVSSPSPRLHEDGISIGKGGHLPIETRHFKLRLREMRERERNRGKEHMVPGPDKGWHSQG